MIGYSISKEDQELIEALTPHLESVSHDHGPFFINQIWSETGSEVNKFYNLISATEQKYSAQIHVPPTREGLKPELILLQTQWTNPTHKSQHPHPHIKKDESPLVQAPPKEQNPSATNQASDILSPFGLDMYVRYKPTSADMQTLNFFSSQFILRDNTVLGPFVFVATFSRQTRSQLHFRYVFLTYMNITWVTEIFKDKKDGIRTLKRFYRLPDPPTLEKESPRPQPASLEKQESYPPSNNSNFDQQILTPLPNPVPSPSKPTQQQEFKQYKIQPEDFELLDVKRAAISAMVGEEETDYFPYKAWERYISDNESTRYYWVESFKRYSVTMTIFQDGTTAPTVDAYVDQFIDPPTSLAQELKGLSKSSDKEGPSSVA